MRYYLDTEFNGFGGELISLALVPTDPSLESFYAVLDLPKQVDPWVQQHVVPHLIAQDANPVMDAPQPRFRVAYLLAKYMERHTGMTVVADWPTDFEHLLALLISGPGRMQPVPDFQMEFRRLPGFNTASTSRIPHNALADAEALRDYCEAYPK